MHPVSPTIGKTSMGMLNLKNSAEISVNEWRHSSQASKPSVSWGSWDEVEDPQLSLWVLDEPFEFGVLPMQPSSKIGISLLRKVSAYIKTKNMYPALNLSAWMHISQLKLQMGPHIPWIYLRMYDILRQQMASRDSRPGYWDFRCEQLRKGRKDKKDEFRVPTFEFLIFLYIQNSYKIMKRMSVQMTNAVKRQDDRWAIRSSEPKIQSEQLHYQYVYDNIEELIDYLQEGYKSTDEVPLPIIEALNLLLCCTTNPRECVMDSLENVVASPRVARIVGYNQETQTVNRAMFIEWLRKLLKLNPWGSATSFVHSPKIYPCTGPTRKESKDVPSQNRIIFNGQKPPYAWTIISNVCYQVLFHSLEEEFTNLKIHRCNNSYLYVPGVYNCVFIDKCINSTIFLGVSAKVTKFFGCSNIKVYCVSRLVIITDCIKSEFYLLTPCQPILTGSKNDNIQLGPFNTFYPSLQQHLDRADLKPNVSNWNDYVQIAFDGMSAMESSSPILRLVEPSRLEIFNFPFQMPGDTNENPLLIPDEYQESVDLRTIELEEWKNRYFSVNHSAELRTESDQNILNSFWAWLSAKGYGREIDGLVNLKNMLNKNDVDGNFQTEFEFSELSGDPPVTLSLTDLISMEDSLSMCSDCNTMLVDSSNLSFSVPDPSSLLELSDANEN
ncbi:unnamed protein product [Allacma fusca]|uniref:TBCC domain-containing protein 1 n=1 Tax=Allacma fusca TaxID=39272 RepID=A0A8J2KUE6_9HEXA|nr:unnamed protein product [Allacma fusca]